MLSPDNRRLYTDALRPPTGYQFTQAVATTYSLDLETLLTIPLHLALFSASQPVEELLKDGVGLLESLRRTTERVSVFVQGGRVLRPSRPHTLYGLLEPMVMEAAPPNPAGVFHPKLWLLRFDRPDTSDVQLRLLVLSRNITHDRCWDLVLTLEGQPTGQRRKENRPLSDLVLRLPDLTTLGMPAPRAQEVASLAELARTTPWELPEGFEEIRFHALGLDHPRRWLPEKSGQMAVVSPFVTEGALEALAASTRDPLVLISRPEELAKVGAGTLERFARVMVLAEQAELEDGEEPEPALSPDLPNRGLHAKAYVTGKGWHTHLFVGSANATGPALLSGANVEFMAELIGKRSRVGSVESVLEADDLGSILVDYEPGDEREEPDPQVEAARAALEAARRTLVALGLRLSFQEEEGGWTARLVPPAPFELMGVDSVTAWMATRKPETAVDARSLQNGESVRLPEAPLPLLTSFVVFQLGSDAVEEPLAFVLNLASDGMPVKERDAAIVRDVIRNREGFLRYVMLLLAQAGEGLWSFGSGRGSWDKARVGATGDDSLPLFEQLTRAFCREPDRLSAVRRLLEEMGGDGKEDVVPQEFLALWEVFEGALREEERARR
jgi:hypothetical protein